MKYLHGKGRQENFWNEKVYDRRPKRTKIAAELNSEAMDTLDDIEYRIECTLEETQKFNEAANANSDDLFYYRERLFCDSIDEADWHEACKKVHGINQSDRSICMASTNQIARFSERVAENRSQMVFEYVNVHGAP